MTLECTVLNHNNSFQTILLSITNKKERYTIFFITVNALHVSDGFSAHHQELKTVHTTSGMYVYMYIYIYIYYTVRFVLRLIAVFVYKCEPMLAPYLIPKSIAKTYLYP
jgi:hypothetical protein